ncbi:MAG: hypothetical protein HXX09_14180 [Bacteroidetes bacterium]|nr:hypothetical protein [Bacteroidota bacterium]
METKNSLSQVDNTKMIKEQNFPKAIFILTVSIVLYFLSSYFYDNANLYIPTTVFYVISEVYVWIIFRKYLNNFNSVKSIKRVNWFIWLIIIFNIFCVTMNLLNKYVAFDGLNHLLSSDFTLFNQIILIPFLLAYIVLYILIGASIKNITNDNVGFLKLFGNMMMYVVPFWIPLTILFSYLKIDNSALSLMTSIIANIPILIMVIIYFHAQKKIGILSIQSI